MHLLVVTLAFPSPKNPYTAPFFGQQVRFLSERIEYITVLAPTTFVPRFMRRFGRVADQASLPDRYEIVEGRCEVLFPRYFKAPGNVFLRWTTAQWCRIVSETIARFATTRPVSLLHANYGSVSSWAAVCAAQQYRIPCAVTYQGADVHTTLAHRQKGWQLCRDSFRLADLNLSVSRPLEDMLRLHARPRGRCEVLLRGVDQTLFFPASELTGNPHVIFVGRIEPAKGVFDLLSAWINVLRDCPDARLTVVGRDQTGGRFLRKAHSLGIEHSIRLTGPLPPPAVAELMRQSRLLCLPSDDEGTPNCVMEALSCGLPVVATRVGGIPDIVEHEKTGLLIEKGEVASLAAALVTLLLDASRCARMGQLAHAFARAHLDARQSASRLVELFEELVSNHSKTLSAPVPGPK